MLDTLLHTARSKGQLTCEQHQLLVESVLLHLGPCLRPRYVIGEEAEAQKSELSVCMVSQCVAYQCVAYQRLAYQRMAQTA